MKKAIHPIDTEALRKLADAATPGPWETFKTNLGRDNGIGSASPTVPSDEAVMEDAWSDPADAEFIAAAREAVPALLDRIARLEAQADIRGRAVVMYRSRARKAEARVKAVRELHESDHHGEDCGVRDCFPSCLGCDEEYPCPTIRALDAP